MNKTELRRQFLAKRDTLSRSQILDLSTRIAANLFSSFDLSEIRCIHSFLTIKDRGEVETSIIIDLIWRSYPHITVVVPRINRKEKRMECAVYDPMSRLIPNFWGIFEPLNTRVVSEQAVDAVIVPLICFDETGHRVGYGGGYYDKFLSICRPDCLKIGVSFFDPIGKIEDIEDHDIRLDFCVTPEKVWDFKESTLQDAQG
ncbi:MAG: 5-formyltetrahydrofolate cyclo-ligase [Acidobacteriota bacterium]|nr:MAG: 5-formyltetrahydrofolate cyclo-ligase [Acidobacteriota bacterium]